jgi:hypothetical protein
MEEVNKINPDEIVSIINPSSFDFTLKVVDIHNKGEMIEYTVKARESLKLPRYAADHVAERLAQRIENKKSGVLTQAYHKSLLNEIKMYDTIEP